MNRFFANMTSVCLLTMGVLAEMELHNGQHAFYKIEAEIVELQNNNSQISTGKHCDVFTKCDPVIYAYLDLEKPVSPWPGAIRSLSDHQQVGSHTNTDSIRLHQIIGKTLCGGYFNTANLRVEVYDHDVMTQSDLIDQFNCFFVPNVVAESSLLATWSEVKECTGIHNPKNHRLTYRWRTYILPASACGLTFGDMHGTSTASPLAR